jgi:hypothetical protein
VISTDGQMREGVHTDRQTHTVLRCLVGEVAEDNQETRIFPRIGSHT